ncbi:MAG: hypothetical protein EAZ91_02925 [Cytophagales bacterium]|nr:MAG: hypothetical protein EAZ91_02925 [Cytophagales bacterium]
MTVEQHSIESIFHEMGFKSSTEYAIRKAQEELLQELKVCNERIEVFEKKYGMSYMEFHLCFDQLTQVGQYERELDSMDWRVEMYEMRAIEKRLAQLTQ